MITSLDNPQASKPYGHKVASAHKRDISNIQFKELFLEKTKELDEIPQYLQEQLG